MGPLSPTGNFSDSPLDPRGKPAYKAVMSEIETLGEGQYLSLYKQDGWEWVKRPHSTACVGILPILPNHNIILIEQYRVPCQQVVIEIPAGLVGDDEAFQNESLAECAGRELVEETGYRANSITPLIASPTSAGMTPEITHLFAATDLQKVSDGGGVEGENIQVHLVSLDELEPWLAEQVQADKLIDFKIHVCLWLANQKGLL